ncbi:MAG: AMP-binding protein, partial [Rhizobacter sp.]
MMGQMMQMPLMISSLLVHAARHAGDIEIVSKRVEGDLHRYTYRDAELRARKVAQAFARLGCDAGDRVATLAWNGYRHFEIYFGASGSELVLHTINPRLFPDQIAWIANDAADKVLCFDATFLPLVEKLVPQLTSVKHFVLMTGRSHMPAQTSLAGLLCYEDLVDAEDGVYRWPEFDENTASSICYTSGTTGHPKGAVITHGMNFWNCVNLGVPALINPNTVQLVVLPLFHTGGLNCYANPVLHAGGAILLMRAFEPGLAIDYLSDPALGITHFFGVPAPYQFMMQ